MLDLWKYAALPKTQGIQHPKDLLGSALLVFAVLPIAHGLGWID
jgi:hypothetical protein